MPRLDTWHSLDSRANGLNGLMAARDTDIATLLREPLCQQDRGVSEVRMQFRFQLQPISE